MANQQSHEMPGDSVDRPSARNLILGTAGHIDHGKTSLIRALTGTDTDRLPEEKRRGMTIELGFAHLEAGPFHFGVVDVPGHERFVRTMVAGASGIDVALLVVAADDSVMPQTVEHVEVLDLLGVSRGVVAVTKCDAVDEDLPELVAQEVSELLAGTPLAGSAVVPVSSVTGQGLDELRRAIADAAAGADDRDRQGPFRMAIDRVFTVQGRGTVVTGSVLQGRVNEGDALELWPSGRACRVRALQSHNDAIASALGGQRAAINLSGVERTDIERGCELASPGYLRPTRLLDVWLRCLGSLPRPIKSRSRFRLCLGTREVMARLVTPDGEPLPAAAESYAQLRLREPVTAVHGQRFIVRDETAARTVGGGTVLRCSPKRRRIGHPVGLAGLDQLRDGEPSDRVGEVLRLYAFARPDDLTIAAEAGVQPDDVPGIVEMLHETGRLVTMGDRRRGADDGASVAAVVVAALCDRAQRWLERYHQLNADEPGAAVDVFVGYLDRKSRRGLGRALLERMTKAKQVRIQGRYVCHPSYAPELSAQDERIMSAMLEEFDEAGFKPPLLTELKVLRQSNLQRVQKLAKTAVATQQLVEIDGKLYLHHAWAERLRERVRELIESGQDASVSAIRQELDTSRKYAVPFLEHLDRVGYTRREGDRRVLCNPDAGGGNKESSSEDQRDD